MEIMMELDLNKDECVSLEEFQLYMMKKVLHSTTTTWRVLCAFTTLCLLCALMLILYTNPSSSPPYSWVGLMTVF
jgi:hypothetical protein